MPARRPIIIGTAGHVDHGKTALVKALTGVDTDRLPEERAREISIELGFAPLTLPDGTTCSLIDVPGHERFIKNMLAGATGVDVVLLVVDVREGVRQQTREHLDILGLLGVTAGVAALTKIDTVSREDVGPAAAALETFLRHTSLAGCPVVPVSARTGEGLDDLLDALAEVVLAEAAKQAAKEASAPSLRSGPARLAIDRAFVAPGFGSVVTGTVASGTISQGQRLQIYPHGPVVRVRRLEVHGALVPAAGAGERAALNLAGVAGDLGTAELRGLVLAEPGSLEPSVLPGLHLRLLPGAGPLKDLERVRLHAGTAEILGRVILLDGRKELVPGPASACASTPVAGPASTPVAGPAGAAGPGPTPVAFEAEKPLALACGQAFVIRSYSPARTIGGGTVTVPNLTPFVGERPRGRPAREKALAVLTRGPSRKRVLAGGQHEVDESFYQSVRGEAAARLRAQHETKPHLETVGRETLWSWLESRNLPPAVWLDTLAADGLLVLEEGRVRLAGWTPRRSAALNAAVKSLATALRRGGFAPPSFTELAAGPGRDLAAQALEVLVETGEVLCPTGLAGALAGDPVFHRDAVAAAQRLLEDHLDRHGEITVAAFRDLIGSTRKFALPLLEHFDREKVTRRRGDLRVRHPAEARRGDPREVT